MSKFSPASLAPRFKENVVGVCGERGRRWLADLPKIVGEISEKWSLRVEEPFPNLSYNYVAPCECADGSRAVLKIGLPEAADSVISGEANYLNLLQGSGAAEILRFDRDCRAMLLERLIPGEDLKGLCEIDDERATLAAVEVLRRISRSPPPDEFPDLDSWTESFRRARSVNFGLDRIRKAQDYFAELIEATKEPLLLHGDFHHRNILSARREPFLAIDPKGIVGDLGFEIAVFLNNPRGWLLSQPEKRAIADRRIEIFSEAFALKASDLRKWAFAEAILSAWWTLEEGGADAEKWLACAAIWET